MNAIAVIRKGTGPEVLLVHGGASPATAWSGLGQLTERWSLAFVYRRGFPPSPPAPGGRQDFNLDAEDFDALLDDRPHVVGHSYRAVGAVIAAISRPTHVRSLTLLEPALFVPVGDPEAERFRRMGDAVATALDAQRVTAPGARHFVAAAPGFADQLEGLLISAS